MRHLMRMICFDGHFGVKRGSSFKIIMKVNELAFLLYISLMFSSCYNIY